MNGVGLCWAAAVASVSNYRKDTSYDAMDIYNALDELYSGTPNAKYKGIDTTEEEKTNIQSYTDFGDISEYAIPSVQYVVGSNLMKGKTAVTFNPTDNATRAEIAAILHRFIETYK